MLHFEQRAVAEQELEEGVVGKAGVAGSGRTADQLASAVRGGPAHERAVRLAASDLVAVVDADDLAALQGALGARLQPPV